ncbi:uncharacterized protein V6R79_009136 [Siganus canaliculatus]
MDDDCRSTMSRPQLQQRNKVVSTVDSPRRNPTHQKLPSSRDKSCLVVGLHFPSSQAQTLRVKRGSISSASRVVLLSQWPITQSHSLSSGMDRISRICRLTRLKHTLAATYTLPKSWTPVT